VGGIFLSCVDIEDFIKRKDFYKQGGEIENLNAERF